jgi:hypothetical protein
VNSRVWRSIRAVIVLLLWLIATPALTQPMLAIDCAKPAAPIDKLVCADDKLAALNRATAERYQTLGRAMSPVGFALAQRAAGLAQGGAVRLRTRRREERGDADAGDSGGLHEPGLPRSEQRGRRFGRDRRHIGLRRPPACAALA